MTWHQRSVFAAPFALRTSTAFVGAGIHTLGQLAAITRDELGERLPALSSAQLDGVSAVLDDARAGAAA